MRSTIISCLSVFSALYPVLTRSTFTRSVAVFKRFVRRVYSQQLPPRNTPLSHVTPDRFTPQNETPGDDRQVVLKDNTLRNPL